MKQSTLSLLLSTLIVIAPNALAKKHNHNHDHDEHQHREHAAHVHGEANLNIVIEDNTFLLELETPAYNIIGFEYKPKTKKEIKAAQDSIKTLRQLDNLLTFKGQKDCSVVSMDVDYSYLEDIEEAHDHHDHNKHDHSEHKHKKHKHEKHDHDKHAHKEHKHDHDKHDHKEHDHHDHDESNHSEYHITYELNCPKANDIDAITVQWFKQFPNTKYIQTNVLTDNAFQKKLSAKDNTISLR